MEINKMKVFHGLVNYGTQAGLFAKELRNDGIEAISVVIADPFQRLIDVELRHSGNFVQKVYKHSLNYLFRVRCMLKYNIFHFYYGKTLLPRQIDLYFYKLTNKKVIFHYLGGDVDTYPTSSDGLDYYGAKINNKPTIKRLKHETKFASFQFVCAPCYCQFVKNSIVLPLAIDLQNFEYIPANVALGRKIKILHAPTNRRFKNSDYIENAIDRLTEEGYDIEYICISNVTHAQLIKEYIKADLVIDQLNFWYGTVSIEAMALGKPVIAGYDDQFFKYIDYGDEIPIINANIDNIYTVLKRTIDNRYLLPEIGKKSREFVTQIHDLKRLTRCLITYYKNLF